MEEQSTVVLEENVTNSNNEKKGLRGDFSNVCFLVLLYSLQGIIFGILAMIPMRMSANNVGYDKQALFSIANYPYVLKLLWAPIVDAFYSNKCGRRKSWLIPVQYAIGVSLIIISLFIDELIGSKTKPPQIYILTSVMLLLVFLTATQDVTVDGWALTLLSRRNVQYVSPCNDVGFVIGSFLSTTVFQSLESPVFCNKWLRSEPQEKGILDIQWYFMGTGVIFTLMSTFVSIFKQETQIEQPIKNNIFETYRTLLKLLKLRSVKWLIAIQWTQYISASVFIVGTELKIIQFGVRRETFSLLLTPVSFLKLLLPFLVVYYTNREPLHYFWKLCVIRLITTLVIVPLVYWTEILGKSGQFPIQYYVALFIINSLFDIINYSIIICIWAYLTKVADPKIGATNMTLFSTISNIGFKWTATVSLLLINLLTFKKQQQNTESNLIANSAVESRTEFIDGFYIESGVCIILGVVWLVLFKKLIWKMQSLDLNEWRIKEQN